MDNTFVEITEKWEHGEIVEITVKDKDGKEIIIFPKGYLSNLIHHDLIEMRKEYGEYGKNS